MAKKKTTTKKKTTRRPAAQPAKKAKTVKKKVTAKKTPTAKGTQKKVTGKTVAGSKSASRPVKPAAGKKVKTKLGKKELLHYRDLLILKRAELLGDLDGMADSALRGKDTSNLSTMPLHMADVGSDNYDQDLMLGLMESERKLLREIEDALHRIADGTFGICQATGNPINKARLEAKPWAKYCIEAAREMERNGNGG